MATIDSLAPELLVEICAHLPAALRYRDLLRASLVCRWWREPAQRVLFRTVVLRTEREAALWLASPARSRYCTKGLTVNSDTLYGDMVLEACPRLSSLDLSYATDADGGYRWCTGQGPDLKGAP